MSITRKKLANILPIAESDVTNLVTDLASKLTAANNLSDVSNASTSRTNLGIPFTYNTFTYSGTFSLPAILQTMVIAPTVSTDVFKLPNMTTDAWTLNRPFLIINNTNTSAKIQLFDASSLVIMDPYEVIEVICTDKSTTHGTFLIVSTYLLTAGSFANFLRKDFNLSDVTDTGLSRINLGLGSIATHNTSEYCATANNLSDLASTTTARTNLGLGTIATHATTEYCATANNLSDLANATTARTNLGLGSIATHATTEYCATANNLSDVANSATAISNLGAEASAWTINAQTGTTYTLTAADFVNTLVTFNNASAITVTVPQTSVTSIAAGKKSRCLNLGTGTVTFLAQGSDSLNGSKTLLTNAFATITKVVAGSPNTYNVLAGTSTITADYTLFIPTVANGTFNFNPKSSVAGTLTSIAGITSSGTCTVKVAINGLNVTGTSLSAGTSLTAQTITGSNTFPVDSPIQAVISSNSSALNLALRVTYTTLQ